MALTYTRWKTQKMLRTAMRAHPIARRLRVLLPPLKQGPAVTVLDVGAQALDDEEDIFRALLDAGNCRVIGVEPLEDTHEKRLARDPNWTLLPYFAGDGTRRSFYRTIFSPTSSLYKPNAAMVSDFEGLAEICTVTDVTDVDTICLDDFVNERVDMLKLDVQGAELDVLRGAERVLADVLVVHVEVEFSPLYKEQPLFDKLFGFLTERGFDFFDFSKLTRYAYKGAKYQFDRLLWAEAVFIPNSLRTDQLDYEGVRRLARIMQDVYGSTGFAHWLLEKAEIRSM